MIEYLKLFLVVYGWSVICCDRKQEKNPYQYITACCAIIVTLFVFALLQCLRIGIYFIYIIGLIGILYGLKQALYNTETRGALFQRVVVLFIIFFMAHFASWGADYWAWDEFSHWGTQVEYLTLNGNLHTDAKLLIFPEYIPGLSLWRYFGHFVLKKAEASGIYFTNFLLIFLSIYGIAYDKLIGKCIFRFSIIFFGLLIFFQSLVSTLYADPVQSVLLLCALKIASEKNSNNFKHLVLVTAVVLLAKHVGLIFSLYIISYYTFVNIYVHKISVRFVISKSIVILIAVTLLYLAWWKYLSKYALGKNTVDASLFTSNGIFNLFLIMKMHVAGVLDNRFPHASYVPTALPLDFVASGMSLGMLYFLMLMASTSLVFLPSSNKKLNFTNYIFFIITSLSFLVFLAFIRGATLGLTGDIYSFSRYLVVVFYPFIFLQILSALDFSLRRSFCIGLIILTIYILIAPAFNITLSYKKRDLLGVTIEHKAKAAIVKKYTKENSIVWYVNSEESPAYYMFRTRILPIEVKPYLNGIGLYLYDSLKVTVDLDARIDKFSRMMCDTELIYIDTVPEEFWIQYAALFNKVKGQVYKIQTGSNGHCSAVFLE